MANSPSGESVITRIVRLLDALGADEPAPTPSELARRTGLPVSTVHRLVGELAEVGWIARDEAGGLGLGLAVWELVQRGRAPYRELQDAARPVMRQVQHAIHQNTQLAVLTEDRSEVLFLDCLSDRESVATAASPAGRLPAFRSSAGLSMVAFGPRATREAFVRSYEAEVPALRARLAEVRRSGVAVASGLIHADTSGVSAPIRDRGEVVAALSVVVPRDEAVVRGVVRPLVAAADRISASLGRR